MEPVTLSAVVEQVPEGLEAYYRKSGDTWVLRVSGMVLDSEVQGLRDNRDSLLREKKELQRQLGGVDLELWDKVKGIDPAEYQALKSGKSDEAVATLQGQVRALTDKLAKQGDQASAREQQLLRQLNSVLMDDHATRALVAHGAKAVGGVNVVLPHVTRALATEEVDTSSGKVLVVRVKDRSGNTRMSPKPSSAEPMSVEELVEEMADSPEFRGCFEARSAGGGGATGSSGASGNRTFSRAQLRADAGLLDTIKEQLAKDGKTLADVTWTD